MSIFDFRAEDAIGEVRSVETSKLIVRVTNTEKIQRARVGRLVTVQCSGDEWLIGMIDKIWRHPVEVEEDLAGNMDHDILINELPVEENGMWVSLIGTYREREGSKKDVFSRAVAHLPEINRPVYPIEDMALQNFMGLISGYSQESTTRPLKIGTYALDGKALAFLDGDKFFQRHAAVLGSTGSGKSWAVATLLEQAAKLDYANIIVFDLHGEYASLTFAKHYRVAGPGDLIEPTDDVIFLPYWLLNYEEMQSMFIDRSEFTAHNQALVFHDLVERAKKDNLVKLGKEEVLTSFTIDSPIPFDFNEIESGLKELNEEMVPGSRGERQGKFYGQFSRLLVRLKSRRTDRRYGFLFQAPEKAMEYEALHRLATQLLGYGSTGDDINPGIKVIDFSEVPSDILPVIVSLVARLVFQLQFWSDPGEDGTNRHPVALICDEAHLYLPNRKETLNPLELRALENFERIAKEGRKYGVGLVVISQRPSDVSTTILSQCNNFISLRLTNREDQNVVKQLMPESLEGIMEVLPTLDIGEAVVVGDSILLPTRIRIAEPSNKPLSATIDFWQRWGKHKVYVDLVKAVESMRRQCRV